MRTAILGQRKFEERLGIAATNLAKVHLVEDNLVRVADAPETSDEGENSDDDKGDLVVTLLVLLDLALLGLGQLAVVGFDGLDGRVLFLRGDVSLAQAAWGRRARHDVFLFVAWTSQYWVMPLGWKRVASPLLVEESRRARTHSKCGPRPALQ